MQRKMLSRSLQKRYLPGFLMTLILSVGHLPAKAQFQAELPSTQIAQSSDGVQGEIQQQAEAFVDLLDNQEFAEAREALHPDLRTEWPSEKIEQAWNDMLAERGTIKMRGESRAIQTVTSDLVIVPIEFEQTTQEIIITFNESGEIVGLNVPPSESIETIAEKFVDDLAAEDFTSARQYLHPFLKTEVFPQRIQQGWQQMLNETGPYQRRVNSEVRRGSTMDGVNVVFITVEFEKVANELLVIFDDEKQIVGVDYPEIN